MIQLWFNLRFLLFFVTPWLGVSLLRAEEPVRPKLPPDVEAEVRRLEQVVETALGHLSSREVAREAIPSAERAYQLRRRHQGESWWETVDRRLRLELLNTVAEFPRERETDLERSYQLKSQLPFTSGAARFDLLLALGRLELKLFEGATWRLGDVIAQMAKYLQDIGRPQAAEPLNREALAIRARLVGKEHPQYAVGLNDLAMNLDALGRGKEAAPLWRESIGILERVLGRGNPVLAVCLNNLALNLRRRGMAAEAETLHREALSIRALVFGPEHPDYATSLNNLALVLKDLRQATEAEPLLRKALTIRERSVGKEHPDYATGLTNLGLVLQDLGRSAEAAPLLREALAIRGRVVGTEHQDYATSLNNLAVALREGLGRSAEAEPLLREALAIRERVLGKHHPDYFTSLSNMAVILKDLGRLAEAEPLLREALIMRERISHKEHADFAKSLSNFASVLQDLDRLAEAESLLREALAIRGRVVGKENADYAMSLNNYALVLKDLGRTAEAESLLREALAIWVRIVGKEHASYAMSLSNLGSVLQDLGRSAEAEPLLREALAIRVRIVGKEHKDYAKSLNNLGSVLQDLGRSAEAEPLLREALAIQARVEGKGHPDYATSLTNLGLVLQDLGRSAEAEPLKREALAIQTRVVGKKHSKYAMSLSNLAGNLQIQGRSSEAEMLLREAVAIQGRVLGKEHPDYAISLNNLAVCLNDLGRAAEAERVNREVLAILGKTLGKEHPKYATCLNNLARTLEDIGRVGDAEPLQREALRIRMQVLGENHPNYAGSLHDLAYNLSVLGQFAEAESLAREAVSVRERVLGKEHPDYARSLANLGALLLQSREKDRGEGIAMLVRSARVIRRLRFRSMQLTVAEQNQLGRVLPAISLSLPSLLLAAKHSGETRSLMEELLLGKHLTADLRRGENAAYHAIFANATPEWRAAWQEQESLVRYLASRFASDNVTSAMVSPVGKGAIPVRMLQERIDALEKQLRISNADFAAAARLEELTLADIEKSIAPSEALLELIRYLPYDAASNRFGAMRYLAVILQPGRDAARLDLGPAETIEDAVHKLQGSNHETIDGQKGVDRSRKWWHGAESRTAEAAARLRELVWGPLEPHLRDAKRVYIGPDGSLALVPFEMLAVRTDDGKWRYLAEEKELVYVNTGRDLARLSLRRDTPSAKEAVLVSNPDFNATLAQLAQSAPSSPAVLASSRNGVQGQTLGHASVAGEDTRLAVPRNWAQVESLTSFSLSLSELLTKAGWRLRLLENSRATEDVVAAIQAPRLLQFATHGYVIDAPADGAKSQSPLLRSMLILAGANRTAGGTTVFRVGTELLTEAQARARNLTEEQLRQARVELADGVLTALEAARMNLFGTELVNLTACETGLGAVTLDGVAGLRMAFLNAGARSVTMSLFEVPATETLDQFREFFRRWLERGATRYQAFRSAQLEALKKARLERGSGHPFFWAGSIFVGDPGDLRVQSTTTGTNR